MTEKVAGTKIWCPFYRGVRLIWVSVLRGSTVKAVPNDAMRGGTFIPKSHSNNKKSPGRAGKIFWTGASPRLASIRRF